MQDLRNRNGVGQTMALLDSIGEDAQSIYKSFKKRSTQKGIVSIMADPNMNAEQKERAMMKLPFHAENEAFQYLRADLTKKRAAKERIDYQLQLKGQLYQQNQDLQQQTYADQGFSEDEIGQANRYDAGIVGRPSITQDPQKQFRDELKFWTTERKRAAGDYYGLGYEGVSSDPIDPIMFKKANENITRLLAEQNSGGQQQPGLEFEQRMNQQDAPFIQNEDGTRSTHKMISFEADGKFYAAPTIVTIDGKLTELSPDEAIKHAFKTGEVKEFATEAEAQAYGEGSWKQGQQQQEPIQQEQQTKGDVYNKLNEFMSIGKEYKANPDDFDRLIEAVQTGQLTIDEAVELIRQSRGEEAATGTVKPYQDRRRTLTRQVQ
jgi:hypothetical protein